MKNKKDKRTKQKLIKQLAELQKKIDEERIKQHLAELKQEFKKNLATFITAAFSFVAALLWRDVITGMINLIIKTDTQQLLYKLYAALIVTAISVVFIYIVSKLFRIKE